MPGKLVEIDDKQDQWPWYGKETGDSYRLAGAADCDDRGGGGSSGGGGGSREDDDRQGSGQSFVSSKVWRGSRVNDAIKICMFELKRNKHENVGQSRHLGPAKRRLIWLRRSPKYVVPWFVTVKVWGSLDKLPWKYFSVLMIRSEVNPLNVVDTPSRETENRPWSYVYWLGSEKTTIHILRLMWVLHPLYPRKCKRHYHQTRESLKHRRYWNMWTYCRRNECRYSMPICQRKWFSNHHLPQSYLWLLIWIAESARFGIEEKSERLPSSSNDRFRFKSIDGQGRASFVKIGQNEFMWSLSKVRERLLNCGRGRAEGYFII